MTKIVKFFILFFLLFLLLFIQTTTYSHPVHYSVTNIDYNTANNQILGTVKIFKDDLWVALIHNYDEFNLNDTSNLLKNAYFLNYLNSRFQLYTDTIYYDIKIVDLLFEESFVIVKFIIYFDHKLQKLCINNSIFFDIYLDQSNMLIFSIDNKEEKGYMIYSYTGDICIDL